MSIRFHEDDVRSMGRTAVGVRGIDLEKATPWWDGDPASAGNAAHRDENGYGKRTAEDEYRLQSRGARGSSPSRSRRRPGRSSAWPGLRGRRHHAHHRRREDHPDARPGDRVIGRNTQGVRLIGMEVKERVSSFARLAEKEE